jgi:parallel beta-helix repeat protein
MRMRLVAIVLIGIVLFANIATAVERHVPSEYSTIQASINVSSNGDVVIIAPGTYTGDGNRDIDFLGKAIIVRSTDPNDPCIVATTIIDCNSTEANPHRGFRFISNENANSILSGFTIINAYYTGDGGGIYCNGSNPTISHCTISNCVAHNSANLYQEHGGGICLNGSSPTITHCIIKENTANGGGAIYCNNNSNPIINNCILTDNTVSDYGGGINCWDSRPAISHCTISGNSAGVGGGISYGSNCNLSASHCIIWGNSNGDFVKTTSVEVWPTVSYSDVGGSYAGTGNIASDPLFINPATGDYHIAAHSPCIDTGDPSYAGAPGEIDIDGDPRVVNSRIDIGADEYTTGPSVIKINPEQFTFISEKGGSNPPSQILYISNVGEGQITWTINTDCNWLLVAPNTGVTADGPDEIELSIDMNNLTHGIYQGTLLISDPCAGNSPQTATVTLFVNVQLLVPSEYDTIQSAIDSAINGDVVIVAPGTYTGDGNRDIDFLGKAITVRSTDPNDPCIIAATTIDCQNTNHRGFKFISNEGRATILEGLTIIDANIAVMCGGGAGICIDGASPTISKCAVTNNHTQLVPESLCFCYGGGIYIGNESNPLITNCIITGNSVGNSGWGGGISCFTDTSAQGTVRNCLIINNTSGSAGGGICTLGSSSFTISNCTIANNSASGDGGAVFGFATIKDSIIWANTGINQLYGSPNITYSDVQGGYTGTGNINADPCFVTGPLGDYYLSQTAAGQTTNSPCVDTGSDTAENLSMNSITTRTDGVPDTGVVNMGYHYPTSVAVHNSDLNGNFFVDFFDYALMALNWQQSPDPCDPHSGDIIKNGIVDIQDLAELCTDWLACYVTFAVTPEPADHALGVSRYPILRWSPGENSISQDVYFGTNFNVVDTADITSSGVYMGNQGVNYWDSNNYANELGTNTTYYWRIDEIGPACSTKGTVWRFTTLETNGPAAWWKFDEGTGTIAYDSVDSNNGTIYGGATWTTGRIGGALSFNGSSNYVDCGNGPSNYDNITVSAWMQTSTSGVLVSNRYNSGGYGTWYTLSSTTIELGGNSSGSGAVLLTFNTSTLNSLWHHIVYTKDGTNHAIYVDGSLDQSFTSNADISWNVPLYIGKRWNKTNSVGWFNGIIDDVRLYNRALTAEEVNLLYQQGL